MPPAPRRLRCGKAGDILPEATRGTSRQAIEKALNLVWRSEGFQTCATILRFMESPLFRLDLLTGHEPKRAPLTPALSPRRTRGEGARRAGEGCSDALFQQRFMGSGLRGAGYHGRGARVPQRNCVACHGGHIVLRAHQSKLHLSCSVPAWSRRQFWASVPSQQRQPPSSLRQAPRLNGTFKPGAGFKPSASHGMAHSPRQPPRSLP